MSAFRRGLGSWQSYQDWPVPGTEWTRYYLRSGAVPGRGGVLSLEPPGADEPPDVALTAPAGARDARAATFFEGLGPELLWAQRQIGSPWPQHDEIVGQDIDDASSLSYVTEPFGQDVDVTGPLTLSAYVAAAAPDTQIFAQVSDVWPDGHARFLANGMLRASLRRLDESTTLRNDDADVIIASHYLTREEPLRRERFTN